MSGTGGTGGTRRAVGARFTPRRIRVALTAQSHVMRQAVAVSCGKNARCAVTVAVVLVAAPVPSIPDQYRILAPSPSSREWTDPADGRVVTGGLVHVVRFEPGWRAFSEAVVKCSASPVAPWHHDALSGHEGVREVLVGAKEQRRRNG